jgi:hypothetical protein
MIMELFNTGDDPSVHFGAGDANYSEHLLEQILAHFSKLAEKLQIFKFRNDNYPRT